MLTELFRQVHSRYSSLPVLGPILDGFAEWLFQQGYRRALVRRHLQAARHVDAALQRRGCVSPRDITRNALSACLPKHAQDDPNLASTLRLLERHLAAEQAFPVPQPNREQCLLTEYGAYLEGVRGLAPATIAQHLRTGSQILDQIHYEVDPARLADLTGSDIETFVRVSGERLGRKPLQNVVAQLRSFLRFLSGRAQVALGLDGQIDTPRVYRGERLPRSLPWRTVQEFLRSIVFLRGRVPAGRLKPTAVTEAFQAWARRSGLTIPFQGPHCLRHSYAVHLLRQGVPLKTIGDVLGHRSAESTCVYIRLAVEDLRDVALRLPAMAETSAAPRQVRS